MTSKRVEEQLRKKEELRQQREQREREHSEGIAAATSPSRIGADDRSTDGSPVPAATRAPSPAPAGPVVPSVGDMRTAGAATRRITEGWEKGLAAQLEEKTAEAALLAEQVNSLKTLGVEWKILPIDPKLVRVVGFNRFSSTFDPRQDRGFADLKANIEAVGGNKQPGMVRPSAVHEGEFELVFGERRLRACEQASLPFTAIVASIDDDDVWLFREAENFGRKDKGILELALGLVDMPERFAYGERTAILEKLKISQSHYQRLKKIAGVPKAVWEVLPNAHTTTAREAAAIVEAYRLDARAVKARSTKVRPDMRRSDAVKLLVTGSMGDSGAQPSGAAFSISRKGAALSIRLSAESDESAAELEEALRRWLDERGLHATATN